MSDLKMEIRRQAASQELEAQIDLEASPQDVWRALTEAEELVRWFPLQAAVEPGPGGKVHMSWDGAWEADVRIEAWEPARHLRTTWPWTREDKVGPAESPVVVDYYIEPRAGGGARLRLVHSGFPVGEGWDDVFDGTRRGWSYELQSLGHYLEHHRGKDRRLVRLRRPMIGCDERQVWDRFWSVTRLEADGGAESTAGGRPYRLQLPGGIEIDGKILVAIPPTDLGVTVTGADRSLLRLAVGHESAPDEPREVQIWLASWSLPGAQTKAIGKACEELLDAILGRAPDGLSA